MDAHWTSTAFRAALLALVRRRVPERDAEDVVQAVLAEALASPHRPHEPEAARRWLWGVARHKIADYHRAARPELVGEPEAAVEPPSHEADDLLRWAVGELPDTEEARRTLAWLLRESEGEKLDEIAEDDALPPAQVRQRVSRLRRHFRARWALYAAALGLLVVALFVMRRRAPSEPRAPLPVGPVPEVVARLERASTLRREALRACGDARYDDCVRGLDAARELDPAGDNAPALREARQRALSAPRAPAPLDASFAPPPLPVDASFAPPPAPPRPRVYAPMAPPSVAPPPPAPPRPRPRPRRYYPNAP